LCLVALFGQGALWHIDVFKQNRGVIENRRHAIPRIWGLLWRSCCWSACLTVLCLGIWARIADTDLQPDRFQRLGSTVSQADAEQHGAAVPPFPSSAVGAAGDDQPVRKESGIGQGNPLDNLVVPRLAATAAPIDLRGGLGAVALALWASLIGGLIQWLWEEKSAAEPI
jgi:hypothetical protein